MRLSSVAGAVLCAGAVSAGSFAQSAGVGRQTPNPCSLLTKAEIQKATGRTDVMRSPNMSDQMPSGQPVCTIDGGGDLSVELIVYPRTVTTPLQTPKDAEAIPGVGAGAHLRSAPGNVAVFTINSLAGAYALHVGLQSDASVQAMRPIAIALAQAAVAKLK